MATDKNILITAGPTWVPIDKVRVIGNLASGETGLMLAGKLSAAGARVTLLLGPTGPVPSGYPGVRIIRFRYFSEIEKLLHKELSKGVYSAVIHSAAVSDYKPKKKVQGKTSSGLKSWKIELLPTKKLINGLKRYPGNPLAVGFKFEPDLTGKKLVREGEILMKKAGLDIVVANSNKKKYKAYILDGARKEGPFPDKDSMSRSLVRAVMRMLASRNGN
ncbi:MAG: phosphopantothenoylcysteine decarboxylase [Candidatus Omnitrophota bacterium]